MSTTKFAELHQASRSKLEELLKNLHERYDVVVHTFRGGKDLGFAKSLANDIKIEEDRLSNFEKTNELYARIDRVLQKACELSGLEPVEYDDLPDDINPEQSMIYNHMKLYFRPKMDGIGLLFEFETRCGQDLDIRWIVCDDIAYNPKINEYTRRQSRSGRIIRFRPGFSRRRMIDFMNGSPTLNDRANGFIDQMLLDLCEAIDTVDPDMFKKIETNHETHQEIINRLDDFEDAEEDWNETE